MTTKTCPLCGRNERCRAALSRKWKLLFFVRSYSCCLCNSQYIVLPGLFSLLVERGFKSFYIPASKGEAAHLLEKRKFPAYPS
jgi:hypothetical protein